MRDRSGRCLVARPRRVSGPNGGDGISAPRSPAAYAFWQSPPLLNRQAPSLCPAPQRLRVRIRVLRSPDRLIPRALRPGCPRSATSGPVRGPSRAQLRRRRDRLHRPVASMSVVPSTGWSLRRPGRAPPLRSRPGLQRRRARGPLPRISAAWVWVAGVLPYCHMSKGTRCLRATSSKRVGVD